MEMRFPAGMAKCDSEDCAGQLRKHHRVSGRTAYACDHCGHHLYPLAGTIFEKSSTALRIWFQAMYLMGSTRCGISAKQIQRETGVTYKTAWRMFKQIRSMLEEKAVSPLGGRGKGVEVDETYFGGKGGKPGRSVATKTPIIGIAERKGDVRAFVARDTKIETIYPLIQEHVMPRNVVFTDEYNVYNGLGVRGYHHHRVRHTERVYVAGDAHTNSLEGFWSLVKRGIGGVYHNVGRHYLQSYLNEYSFRYNRRFDTQPMFASFLQQIQQTQKKPVCLPASEQPQTAL